jgi:hypothetical protein
LRQTDKNPEKSTGQPDRIAFDEVPLAEINGINPGKRHIFLLKFIR